MTPPADIPTRFMADWLYECLKWGIRNRHRPAINHFAKRLEVVLEHPRYIDKEAA